LDVYTVDQSDDGHTRQTRVCSCPWYTTRHFYSLSSGGYHV